MAYEGLRPVIRSARATDAPQVISGIEAVCAEGGAFYTTRFVNTPQWDAVLHHPETVSDHMLAVADLDGEIIGAGRLFPGGVYTLMNHVAELGLFVSKPVRQQGVGTMLLNWLVNWAIQAKLEKITIYVFSTNDPAVRFFGKHGFIQSGRMHRQIKTSGHYIDVLLMERFLQ
jgi:L-amino acid N-acyltransferase YncA